MQLYFLILLSRLSKTQAPCSKRQSTKDTIQFIGHRLGKTQFFQRNLLIEQKTPIDILMRN